MKNEVISKEVGKYLVIRLDESTVSHIAEVLQSDPLIVKITEEGPLSRLKESSHFIVLETETKKVQGSEEESTQFLAEAVKKGKPLISGLRSLGIGDNVLHEILPALE